MNQKSDLLIFSKKEFVVILMLLVLVALFSFTLGLKMGATLGLSHKVNAVAETTPAIKSIDDGAPAAQVVKEDDEASEEVTTADKQSLAAEESQVSHESAVEQPAKENAAPPTTTPEKTKAQSGPGAKYTLQVGSYRTITEAADRVTLLKHSGLDAFYLPAEVPGKGTWYRVGIGVFQSKAEADHAGAEWKKTQNLPDYIVQKVAN